MNCQGCESRLSDYLERGLSVEEMTRVAEHLNGCAACASLLEGMRSVVAACRAFPAHDPGVELLDRILLRTTGRPRTRSLREHFDLYVRQPLLTPRFAMGTALAAVSLILVVSLMLPRMSAVASALSPREVLRQMDVGVQRVYGEGLRLYDRASALRAQFAFFRDNVFNRLGFMIEKLDTPAEVNQQPGDAGGQEKEKAPGQKSSLLLLPA